MIKTSLIINTACLDPFVGEKSNLFRVANYGDRLDCLEEYLELAHKDFDEVIVAGTFKEGKNYRYIPVQPRYRDRRDALYQREFGARHSTGDVLVFCHDDHQPETNFGKKLIQLDKDWDILIPERRHFLTDAVLNNGKDGNYMGGHCLAMKRWLWAEVSWLTVDTEWWDLPMTRLWKEVGGRLLWTDKLVHYDMEVSEEES